MSHGYKLTGLKMCDACEGKTVDNIVEEHSKYFSDTNHSIRYPSVEEHYSPISRIYHTSGGKYA